MKRQSEERFTEQNKDRRQKGMLMVEQNMGMVLSYDDSPCWKYERII